jgi:hypothetical protein
MSDQNEEVLEVSCCSNPECACEENECTCDDEKDS